MHMSKARRIGNAEAERNKGTPSAPLAHTIDQFAARTGLGRTTLYAAARSGRLRLSKLGRRTLILAEDGEAFLASLRDA